jgi:hypothetical protein
MLIETLGVDESVLFTVLRGKRPGSAPARVFKWSHSKVAMVDTTTRDTSHVDELRRGSRYCLETKHPNI